MTMKLHNRILISISVVLVVLLTAWAFVFYYQMMDEINDETDDALEDYADRLIQQSLVTPELLDLTENDGSNNNYYFEKITPESAKSLDHICYLDTMLYIASKLETEPARILKVIFKTQPGDFYRLTISTPTIEKNDLKKAMLISIIILYLSLLLTIIIVNIWVYVYNLKPLHKTLKWLSNNDIGSNSTPLSTQVSIKEFKMLNEEINKYVSRTEQAYQEQKNFISSASHELQTPIAICQNRLDMLLSHTELTEEQMDEIIKISRTLNYMAKLNKTLLFLSKIYNHQFPEKSKLSFLRIVNEEIPDYQEAYSYKNISFEVVQNEDFIIEMNESLATSLITNLIKNAFVHNREGGKIEVRIGKNGFEVRNTGKIDEPLNKDLIFKQYFHSKNSEESTGLGLTIVTAIAKLYILKIDYSYRDGYHVFSVSPPVTP